MNSENPAQPISVVLMDDHRIVREGLAAFCDARPELHIAGQCSDGLAAVEMIKALTPDFAIIDLQLPNLHGLEVIRKVRETNAVCKLVVFTISRDEKMVLEALRAGANGYLVKDGPARHLLDAIRCIRDGGSLHLADTARVLTARLTSSSASTLVEKAAPATKDGLRWGLPSI